MEMNKEQEKILEEAIRDEMTKLRNSSIVAGMKGALGAIYGICQKEIDAESKLKEIQEYCEKGINKV